MLDYKPREFEPADIEVLKDLAKGVETDSGCNYAQGSSLSPIIRRIEMAVEFGTRFFTRLNNQ